MNEYDEDSQTYAASERHHEIMEEGEQYFGGVCVVLLGGVITLFLAVVAWLVCAIQAAR